MNTAANTPIPGQDVRAAAADPGAAAARAGASLLESSRWKAWEPLVWLLAFAAPLLLARGGGNRYARDLGARDSLLLREYPDRPVYLLRPPSGAVGALPRFEALSRDSLLAAWRAAP